MGVEDPRVTYLPRLGRWLMTYVAYGPFGPRIGLAASTDLDRWERLGPVSFAYDPELATDLNLYPNKDALLFPEPVVGPDGNRPTPCSTARCGTSRSRRPGEDESLPAG